MLIASDGYAYPATVEVLNCKTVSIRLAASSDAITFVVDGTMDGSTWETIIGPSDVAASASKILHAAETNPPNCAKLDLTNYVWFALRVGVKSNTSTNPCIVNAVLNRRR